MALAMRKAIVLAKEVQLHLDRLKIARGVDVRERQRHKRSADASRDCVAVRPARLRWTLCSDY